MNKKLFIIGGVSVILILLGVWGYLMVYGGPANPEGVFANLGTNGELTEGGNMPEQAVVTEVPVVDTKAEKLRQLTTGPVAGFKEVQLSTTTPAVLYYVEMGTGHVFTINTDSGEEVRISGTTYPNTLTAEISNNGLYYGFLGMSATKEFPLTVGILSTTTNVMKNSYVGVSSDISFNEQNELYILSRKADNSSASLYNVKSETMTPLFTLPFLEASIDWGNTKSGPHYTYPKPAAALEGQLYEVLGNTLKRLPIEGNSLTAITSGDITLYNKVESKRLNSYFRVNSADVTQPLDSPVFVEKCFAAATEGQFICAQNSTEITIRNQESWYSGEESFSDSVWLLDGNTFTGELLFNGLEESGRQLDIIKLDLSESGKVLYFINKIDNTLWMYEL